jgi:alkanesulfonate monooxygenase SsuD/methylene tetrahydromethanopterin reductase-like flavin-dependent oxidoreductase (luciferase family)
MLPYVARVADRWNAHFVSLETFADMNADLDRNLEEAGRRPGDLHRSVMLGIEVGETREEVDRKLEERSWAFWRDPGMLAGTPDDLPEQFARWEKAGADMIMVQWLDYEDLDGLAVLARALEAA